MATYVLVPGGGWGGFIWRPVVGRLRAAGLAVFAATLTGLGERVHLASPSIDLDTHIQDIVNLLEYEDLERVILVGHSYGGMVITGVAERVPERLAHLMYLDAIVPRDGQAAVDLLDPQVARELADLARTDGGGWRLPLPANAPKGMTAHPWPPMTQPLVVKNAAAAVLPRTYVLCTEPAIENNRQFAARAQAEGWHYRELPTGHMAMLTLPDALTDLLLEVA
jgi:pimeloyl-ACP methyl ester carboxylesterase